MIMASMMTLSPGSVRTMSAAALAASVAPSTAIPISAFLSAGASLTPSPVIPTICPEAWRTSTILYLSSGRTSANPSAEMMMSSRSAGAIAWYGRTGLLDGEVPCIDSARLRRFASSFDSGNGISPFIAPTEWMVVPMPRRRAVSTAIAVWSPVIIFTCAPISCAFSMVRFVSCRGGSKRERTPENTNSSSLFVTATPKAR
mmetsp:Transcript_33175/g.80585  ORF Transcript_33175/g.80585 Transcript_33175/m.80585 type:complete len:201 (+) Transcript_33175:1211-1813(+)